MVPNNSTPKALPKNITKAATEFDIEKKVPVTNVQLEGLALVKMIKHSREMFPSQASGLLLGLDIDQDLEVTNCFPFPSVTESKNINLSQYRAQMISHYRNVNIDSTTVGWYVSSQLNNFFTQLFIDTQASYQKSLGNKCVALVHDVSKSTLGNLHLKAFRLSESFMEVYQKGNFTLAELKNSKLTFANILVEVPITLTNSSLISAMLHELGDESQSLEASLSTGPSIGYSIPEPIDSTFISPNYNSLELNIEPYVERNLEKLIESLDDYTSEQNAFQYHQRALGREKTRIQNYVQSKVQENEARVSKGLKALPVETEEQIATKFKLPSEPSHLDSLITNHQINAYCTQLNQFTGPTLAKMYATQALQKNDPQN